MRPINHKLLPIIDDLYDALRWIAQEARAVKLSGTNLPQGSRLREALDAFDKATIKADATNLPAGDVGFKGDLHNVELQTLCKVAVRALPLLCRLGDFIGNGPINPNRPDSLGERCDVIGDLRDALAALGVPEDEMAPTRKVTS